VHRDNRRRGTRQWRTDVNFGHTVVVVCIVVIDVVLPNRRFGRVLLPVVAPKNDRKPRAALSLHLGRREIIVREYDRHLTIEYVVPGIGKLVELQYACAARTKRNLVIKRHAPSRERSYAAEAATYDERRAGDGLSTGNGQASAVL